MNEEQLNQDIAEEIMKEEEARVMAEFAPKKISTTQVKGAKFAWMIVAACIDFATAYAYTVILAPYWWYAVLWVLAGAGGLIYAEWLWERVGNNEQQTRIAAASKNVSAIAILVMAMLAGVALVLGWERTQTLEIVAVISAIGLIGFHGWQSYQYHEVDDDYIAANEESRAYADNIKEIRKVHRAGQRIAAKKMVHRVGEKYEKTHGQAFTAAAGRSYASTTKTPSDPTEGER